MKQKSRSATEVSAYLDGRLDHNAQVAFDARMAQDPTLRRRVDEMRQVVDMVRAVPLREPPRNYLLSPSMVAEVRHPPTRQQAPLFVMRLATSLVALAFVVTFGLSLLQSGMSPAMVLQSREMPQAASLREEAVTDEVAMDAAAPEAQEMAEVTKVVEVEVEVALAPEAEEPEAPQEEMSLESVPEPAEVLGEAEQTAEFSGIGGGAAPPEDEGVRALETDQETPAPLEAAPEPGTLAEAPAAETPAAAMALAPEQMKDEGQADPTVTPLEPWDRADVVGEEGSIVAPEPVAETQTDAPAESRAASTRALAIGLGIAAALMAAITFWLSRRSLG